MTEVEAQKPAVAAAWSGVQCQAFLKVVCVSTFISGFTSAKKEESLQIKNILKPNLVLREDLSGSPLYPKKKTSGIKAFFGCGVLP